MGLGALSIAQPQQSNVKATTIPGPGEGMNTTGSLYGMSPGEAVYMFNIIPSEFGPRTRHGYREHANGMTGDGIRTIIPFDGSDSDHVLDKLFVATNTDIWDVTLPGPAVSKLTFTDQSVDAGWGHFTHYVNDDGTDFLLAAFEKNGLFEYISATETWQPATGVEFPAQDPNTIADVVFIVSHKQRLWIICDGDSHAYYLPVGSKQGLITRFDFGNKFKHGGELVGLYNWTLDGGDGVDDYLMAVSGGGDIIMYRGEDPSAAETWSTTGTWFVGEIPSGRRGVSEVGGEVWILSTQGVITANTLVRGVYSGDMRESPAFKISRLIRERMLTEKNSRGWEVLLNSNEAQFIINSPVKIGFPRLQYVYSIVRNSWGIWRGIPGNTFGNWNGNFFVGGDQNPPILYEMTGDLDNVLLTPLDDGTDNLPVEFSILGSFQDYGEQSTFKRVQYLRPTFIGNLTPNYSIKAVYDYDISEPTLPIGVSVSEAGIWDIGIWESAIWGGELSAFETLSGGGGLGRVFTYALKGETITRTTMAAIDLMWDSGGML